MCGGGGLDAGAASVDGEKCVEVELTRFNDNVWMIRRRMAPSFWMGWPGR